MYYRHGRDLLRTRLRRDCGSIKITSAPDSEEDCGSIGFYESDLALDLDLGDSFVAELKARTRQKAQAVLLDQYLWPVSS